MPKHWVSVTVSGCEPRSLGTRKVGLPQKLPMDIPSSVVTGAATGSGANLDAVREVRSAVPDRPVLVGSGVTVDTVADTLAVADGVIVGTALKTGGRVTDPVDPERVAAFVRAARGG